MFSFLSTFSDSFLLALLAWPFVAFALTVPVLIIQYRKYNKFIFRRAVGAYLLFLYGLGLVSFTLYPMPSDADAFCRAYNLSPQLQPFNFIADIQSDGARAILQVLMNIAFFVPLGVFARIFFKLRIGATLLVSFLVSIFIETAQLTGGFGVYPCSYRLFDVNDLMINTLGGILGYVIALLVPRREIDRAAKGAVVHKGGLLRNAVAFLLDLATSWVMSIVVTLSIYFTLGTEVASHMTDWVVIGVTVMIFGVIPYLFKGWSLGGSLVRLSADDVHRTGTRRAVYYGARVLFFVLILHPPYTSFISFLLIVATLIVWRKSKKLLYQFV